MHRFNSIGPADRVVVEIPRPPERHEIGVYNLVKMGIDREELAMALKPSVDRIKSGGQLVAGFNICLVSRDRDEVIVDKAEDVSADYKGSLDCLLDDVTDHPLFKGLLEALALAVLKVRAGVKNLYPDYPLGLDHPLSMHAQLATTIEGSDLPIPERIVQVGVDYVIPAIQLEKVGYAEHSVLYRQSGDKSMSEVYRRNLGPNDFMLYSNRSGFLHKAEPENSMAGGAALPARRSVLRFDFSNHYIPPKRDI